MVCDTYHLPRRPAAKLLPSIASAVLYHLPQAGGEHLARRLETRHRIGQFDAQTGGKSLAVNHLSGHISILWPRPATKTKATMANRQPIDIVVSGRGSYAGGQCVMPPAWASFVASPARALRNHSRRRHVRSRLWFIHHHFLLCSLQVCHQRVAVHLSCQKVITYVQNTQTEIYRHIAPTFNKNMLQRSLL